MAKKYKYLDKNLLDRINHLSREVLHYNRTLPQEFVDSRPDDELYAVTFSMIHEHIAGKPADPHVRVVLSCSENRQSVILDMEMGLYDMLPAVEVPDDEPTPESSEPEVAAPAT
jgi:hypothetical protein